MKLQTMFKSPHIRFKTIAEMVTDYGPNWMDQIPWFEPLDALHTMDVFQGKNFYTSLIHDLGLNTLFAYGPLGSHVSINMLTTKHTPKYDTRGNILKPGMIVKVEYLAIGPNERHIVSANLRNIPGTLVRVLKVHKPSDYVIPGIMNNDVWDKVDRMCIVTELRAPFSGLKLQDAEFMYCNMFKNHQACAFEIMHRVCRATDIEKEFYYKTL